MLNNLLVTVDDALEYESYIWYDSLSSSYIIYSHQTINYSTKLLPSQAQQTTSTYYMQR